MNLKHHCHLCAARRRNIAFVDGKLGRCTWNYDDAVVVLIIETVYQLRSIIADHGISENGIRSELLLVGLVACALVVLPPQNHHASSHLYHLYSARLPHTLFSTLAETQPWCVAIVLVLPLRSPVLHRLLSGCQPLSLPPSGAAGRNVSAGAGT